MAIKVAARGQKYVRDHHKTFISLGAHIVWNGDGDRLQRHTDSAHGGKVDPRCPACIEIQARYPETRKAVGQ